jgi:hypothetical protein
MRFLVLFILIITPLISSGQEVHSYHLDIHINLESRSLHVDGYVDVDFQNNDSLNFILWKYSAIEKIEIGNIPCVFSFDTMAASPSFFTPKGKTLTVKRPVEIKGSNQRIHLIYTSDMSELGNSWEGAFTDEWIELAVYSGWYPIQGGNYSAELKVYINEEYKVTGSGAVSEKNGFWEINKSWKSFDIVLMASKDLKSKVYKENDTKIQIDYTNLSDAGSDSTVNDCKFAFRLFEDSFGKKNDSNLKIVMGPARKGGGYSRKHFITMPANNYSPNLSYGNAHEIAHFWWSNAPTNTWEDWLNEAFAEFSALVFMRERFGVNEFNRFINEYKEKTIDTAPVWGVDRQSQEAYYVLYMKGSLILSDLEQKLGTEQFLSLLNKVSDNNISSTEGLLKLISEKVSEDVSKWLENELKTR